jgi:hypothetical protein
MKVLSIDVGIKNLAFCLFEVNETDNTILIVGWDSVDISKQCLYQCIHIEKCVPCEKPAKFMNSNNNQYCLKHAKKQELQIPTIEQNSKFIQKQSMSKLCILADKHLIYHDPKLKKTELIELIQSHFTDNYFKPIETINASDINLFDIGKNLKHHFDKIFLNEHTIDHVIIENQIGPIATRMKTIQGMIVQYFVMSSIIIHHIEFISASNKLKSIISGKTTYTERKKMGKDKCLEIITEEKLFNKFIPFFNLHKKKDDLSDCFLQGIWYIKNKILNPQKVSIKNTI